ncbi:GNAT family N-acetyltransferase [Bauldia litoralis]|uniref:GNAT family N-acetyltransferase n=1 Tax=Bauldia litoralis TaxID=665467 RepID=UPI00326412BD
MSAEDQPAPGRLVIREANDNDDDDVLAIERRAFGRDGEAELVRDLLRDPSAAPRLSMLAFERTRPVGHLLFTAVTLDGAKQPVAAALLAPLAVVPEAQNRGCGTRLVEDGLARLEVSGVGLVFVLGHPTYYPRFGFTPAERLGFAPPYPIPAKDADAWMVRSLRDGQPPAASSVRVAVAHALAKPEYWRE